MTISAFLCRLANRFIRCPALLKASPVYSTTDHIQDEEGLATTAEVVVASSIDPPPFFLPRGRSSGKRLYPSQAFLELPRKASGFLRQEHTDSVEQHSMLPVRSPADVGPLMLY